jgi:hypothetical protein
MATDRRHGHNMVRPFIMTGGRTRPERRDLRLETLLHCAPGVDVTKLPTEQAAILRVCREPQSVAEVGARLGLVVSVVSIVAADLVAAGLLDVHQTDPVEIELDTLLRMIERVRAL